MEYEYVIKLLYKVILSTLIGIEPINLLINSPNALAKLSYNERINIIRI